MEKSRFLVNTIEPLELGMEKTLRALSLALRHITPTRTILLIIASMTTIVSVVLWENRQDFYTRVTNIFVPDTSPPLVLTDDARYKIESMLSRKSQYVVSATVASVSVQLNKKTFIYRAFTDRDVESVVKLADQNEGYSAPVFTNNEQTNRQVLSLIRGEFSCSKIIPTGSDSRFGRFLGGRIQYTCRVPIPPSYGNLIGFVVFHLSREPSEQELDELRLESYTISMHIYNDTFNKGVTKRI